MYINVVIFFQLVFILYFDSLSRRHLNLDCYFFYTYLLFHIGKKNEFITLNLMGFTRHTALLINLCLWGD